VPGAAAAGKPGSTAAASLGAIYVVTRPLGARVSIDGNYVGTTPLLATEIAPGARAVRIEMDGHKPWTSTVDVPAGQRVRVAASLEEGS
jgi:hypothetical protein